MPKIDPRYKSNFSSGGEGWSGFSDNDLLSIVRSETVPRKLDRFDITELELDETVPPIQPGEKRTVYDNYYLYVDKEDKTAGTHEGARVKLSDVVKTSVNPDWNAEEGSVSEIKNKPDVYNKVEIDGQLKTVNEMSTPYRVGNIAPGKVIPVGTSVLEILNMIFNVKDDESLNILIGLSEEQNPFNIGTLQQQQVKRSDLLGNGYDYTFDFGAAKEGKPSYYCIAIPMKQSGESGNDLIEDLALKRANGEYIVKLKSGDMSFNLTLKRAKLNADASYIVYFPDRPALYDGTLTLHYEFEDVNPHHTL